MHCLQHNKFQLSFCICSTQKEASCTTPAKAEMGKSIKWRDFRSVV